MEKIDAEAGRQGKKARVALRVNPDIDAKTHPYISTGLKHNKFGVDIGRAREIFGRSRRLKNLAMTGVQAHIGSQILETAPLEETARELAALAGRARRRRVPDRDARHRRRIRRGRRGREAARTGGLRRRRVLPHLAGLPFRILIEPGRAIVASGRRSRDARPLRQGEQGQAVRHHRRGHERPDPPPALRRDPFDRARRPSEGTRHQGGRRRADLRDERLPRARHRPRRAGRRGPARRPRCRGVRIRDGLQLQLPPARGRGPGRAAEPSASSAAARPGRT